VPHDTPQWPAFDFDLAIGSLPLTLGVSLATLPAPSRYLESEPIRAGQWQALLASSATAPALKVALVWSGNRTH
jgi:hypothetical protein